MNETKFYPSCVLFSIVLALWTGICLSQEDTGCDEQNLDFNQIYYDFKDNAGKDPRPSLRGSEEIYYGQIGKDVIFNITAPNSDVVQVHKVCMFTRNVYSVNVRSTMIYGVIDGKPISGSGVVDGNFPVDDSKKWMKTCIKPYIEGKINQVRIQLRIREPQKRKVRVQKLLMTACRVLN